RSAPQPLAPWSRKNRIAAGSGTANAIRAILATSGESPELRHWAMKLAKIHGFLTVPDVLVLVKDADPEVRADAIWLLGLHGAKREQAGARLLAIRANLQALHADGVPVNSDEILARVATDVEHAFRASDAAIVAGLTDGDALVRRRSCEAVVRAYISVPPLA